MSHINMELSMLKPVLKEHLLDLFLVTHISSELQLDLSNLANFRLLLVTESSLDKLGGKLFIINVNSFFSFRLIRSVCGRYGAIGAAAFVGYQFTFDALRHHDEANSRPEIYDHTLALSLIGMGAAASKASNLLHVPLAGFFTAALIAPISWFLYTRAIRFGSPAPNIFYENGTTAEEVERFRHQDEIERLGLELLSTPNYGMADQ